jgi:uncharacterized membrane protein
LDESRKDPPRPAESSSTPTIGPLIVTHAYFRGPLPPPSVVEAFERAHPGAAERIFAMAEETLRIRHRMDESALLSAIRSEARGQWFAFLVLMVGMGLDGWLASSGHDSAGLLSMLIPLGTVAGLFLYSRNAQARERERKRMDLEMARMGPPA